MRILIISTFFPPLNSIASLRPYSWAKYWSLAGHDVTVLTTVKDEEVKVSLNFPNTGYRVLEVPYPACISRLKRQHSESQGHQKKTKKSILSRFFDYLRFKKGVFNATRMPDFTDLWALKAYRRACEEAPWDLVVSTAGPYTVHLVAHRLKKNGRCRKWIADYRDTWSNNYLYPGLFPFNFIEQGLERYLLKRADLITAVSSPFTQEFKRLYPKVPSETIANGFDPDDLSSLNNAPYFQEDGQFRIVHTGSIYLGKRDPRPLFQAIQNIHKQPENCSLLDKLEVLFVGPRQSNLEELIEQYEVGKWVKMHGFVSREEALRMQRDAHALLFLAWNDLSVDGILTGKIFEYLYSNTPIIALGAEQLEASQKLILEVKAGYVLPSVEAIETYLLKSLRDCKKEAMVYNMDTINLYNRKLLADKLLEMAAL